MQRRLGNGGHPPSWEQGAEILDDHRVNPDPSPHMLVVFAAIIRDVETGELTDLRNRLIALEDPPAAIEVIDRELKERTT